MGEPVTSPDGAVTVSVDALGALEALRLGPASSSMNLDVLAATIVTTSQQARFRKPVAPVEDAAPPPPPPVAVVDDEDDAGGFSRG